MDNELNHLLEEATDPKRYMHITRKQCIKLIDLTQLDTKSTQSEISTLCKRAASEHVAAVCIPAEHVRFAKTQLANTSIKIATVVNFPHGNESLLNVVEETKFAIKEGADEVDLVIPYDRYATGHTEETSKLINAVKKCCGEKRILKVILETGALNDPQLIADISETAIQAGADFLKTSTGKIKQGATLEAVLMMLLAISNAQDRGHNVGLKVSGGIRDYATAAPYLYLAESIMGADWISTDHFRFGASQLLVALTEEQA